VGYGPDDVDKLVEGTLPQHRVTKLSPRPVSAEDLKKLFLDSMTLW
jgi:hydroxyacid-oxoacid transhydrogenase